MTHLNTQPPHWR